MVLVQESTSVGAVATVDGILEDELGSNLVTSGEQAAGAGDEGVRVGHLLGGAAAPVGSRDGEPPEADPLLAPRVAPGAEEAPPP